MPQATFADRIAEVLDLAARTAPAGAAATVINRAAEPSTIARAGVDHFELIAGDADRTAGRLLLAAGLRVDGPKFWQSSDWTDEDGREFSITAEPGRRGRVWIETVEQGSRRSR